MLSLPQYNPIYAGIPIGFLCEHDDKHVKVFDVKNRQLLVLPNCYEEDQLVLGKLNAWEHMRVHQKRPCHNGNVSVYVQNQSEVCVKTVAMSPRKKDLPEEIFRKYKGKVWSPYLGFVRDPRRLFQKEFIDDGEWGYITARYSPNEESVFELEQAHCTVQLEEDLAEAPWTLEAAGRSLEPRKFDLSALVNIRKYMKKHRTVRYGVCVEIGVPNAYYDRIHSDAKQRCAHMASMNLGLYRCNQRVQLGAWYQHDVLDKRQEREKKVRSGRATHANHCSTYKALRATKLFKIDAPLPTAVVDGEVEFEVEFPFEQDALGTKDGLRRDAHFWNQFLGRVEVYPRTSMEIIRRIDAYRENLQEPFKSAAITIVATVKLHRNRYENNFIYPEAGLFVVTKVNGFKNVEGNFIKI